MDKNYFKQFPNSAIEELALNKRYHKGICHNTCFYGGGHRTGMVPFRRKKFALSVAKYSTTARFSLEQKSCL